MSSKRTRVVRSSTHLHLLLNQIRPIESPVSFFEKKRPALSPVAKPAPKPVKGTKPQVVQRKEKPRGGILTVGSPERETINVGSKKEKAEVGFGEFLKSCSLCKKKLKEAKDIFMYGYLSAFCSPECRDDRIALDGFDKQVALEYSEKLKMAAKNKKYTPRQVFGN